MKKIILFSLIFLFVFFLCQNSPLFAQTNSDLIRSEVSAGAAAEVKSPDTENIEIEYVFLEPKIEKVNGGYYSIEMEDTHKYYDKPGLPLLPFKTVKIHIPPGRTVKSINVIRTREIVIDGEFKIEYCKQQAPISRPELMVETEPNQEVYNSGKPFPGKSYSEVLTVYRMGSEVLILNLYPVQYIPVRGEVFYYSGMMVIVATIPTEPTE